MLAHDNPRRAKKPGKQNEKAKPADGVEAEDEAVRQQSAHHHAAAGHVRADFPAEIDGRADNHANQGSHHNPAHVARKMNPVHCYKAGHIADYRHEVRHVASFPGAKLIQSPSVDLLEQVDAEHRDKMVKQ